MYYRVYRLNLTFRTKDVPMQNLNMLGVGCQEAVENSSARFVPDRNRREIINIFYFVHCVCGFRRSNSTAKIYYVNQLIFLVSPPQQFQATVTALLLYSYACIRLL